MSRQKRMVPKSFGDGDYSVVKTTVNKYPKCYFEPSDGNTLKPVLAEQRSPIFIDIPLLCDGRGRNVIPANLYIRYKARHSPDNKTLKDYSQALLAFYRYMSIENKNIYDVCSIKEKGVVYKFRDFLLNNIKRDIDGEVKGIYLPSTASSYLLKIVDYYNFMNASRIVEFKEGVFVPFEYKIKSIQKRKSKKSDNKILGHLDRSMGSLIIKTTEITRPFGQIQTVESHKKLSPMTEDDKQFFLAALNDDFSDPKDLMLRTAVETGLRLAEFVTFPQSEVRDPKAQIVKCTISELRNDCLTKSGKERTIDVHFDLMNQLELYRLSKARHKARNKCLIRHNSLFLKSNGYPYQPNTLEKHFEKIRLQIQEEHPDWYYTIHDLRSTFATHWLYDEHVETGKPFDTLLGDLAELMGHEDTSMTEKYIKYMNTKENWFKFARRQNQKASENFHGGES